MGKLYPEIDDKLAAFIRRQRVFFVATAPLAAEGHVNLSPKGLEALAILGPRRVAYLDLVGSGAETIAHLRENGRIVIMLCAFEGPPRIVRLHGRGRVVKVGDPEFDQLAGSFPDLPAPRSVIDVSLERISDSCGYGVPVMRFETNREQLGAWADHKGAEGLVAYTVEHNSRSIDGLPALL